MISWGYTLSSEEFPASALVEQATAAEAAGFEFLTISDHFHPWTSRQGQSPFAWTTLGAVAARTASAEIGTGVTCPILRYEPVIVAQAAATVAELSGGRFFFGVGTGEALNEHVTGRTWPALERRRAMLAEALHVLRRLWSGEVVDHWGEFFRVENARLFSTPPAPISVIMSASGTSSAAEAARSADGLWSTAPDAEVVDAYRRAGGAGPVYGQITVCWGEDQAAAEQLALAQWPNAGIPGQMSQDLPTWTHFEQLAQLVTVERIASEVVCGPDAGPLVKVARQFLDAGFDHLHVHQVGHDQYGFLDAWQRDLRPALDSAFAG